MRGDHDVMAYAGDAGMGAGDGSDGDFFGRATAIFASELFKPMVARAAEAPGEVRQVIAEIRAKLDALETVVGAFGPEVARPAGSRPGVPPAQAADRTAHGAVDDARDGLDEVGRNQRSRLRELVMLEALSREARPYTLQQITAALDARGFADTSGAIVSQLHRLKKLGVIDQPANGMYVITDQGLGHLRRLRSSFGGMLPPG